MMSSMGCAENRSGPDAKVESAQAAPGVLRLVAEEYLHDLYQVPLLEMSRANGGGIHVTEPPPAGHQTEHCTAGPATIDAKRGHGCEAASSPLVPGPESARIRAPWTCKSGAGTRPAGGAGIGSVNRQDRLSVARRELLREGAWAGKGAEAPRLSSPVEPEAFRGFLEGEVPGGRRLGRRDLNGNIQHRRRCGLFLPARSGPLSRSWGSGSRRWTGPI